MDLTARHFETGAWVNVRVEGDRIASVLPANRPAAADETWIAPAFWDLQTNGRLGLSYSDPAITPEQVAALVRGQAALGTARLCPTSISAPFESFQNGLRALAQACDTDPVVESMVLGAHLEGPYLSALEGYRGAHPADALRDPDWDEFQRFQEASGGRVVLMTLAPERPGSLAFIKKAVASGVRIALGHTAADGPTLRAAVDAGATLSTHLGNGIVADLPRHPNPIWEQAALDGLAASLIADGHHLDDATLKVLARAKALDRLLLVSDASPLAGLPVGTYGPWAVHPSGKIVVAGTPYLAGSNQGIDVALAVFMRATGATLPQALRLVTTNPARLLGREEPALQVGAPANLVLFRTEGAAFRVVRTWVDGNPCEPPQ